MQKLPKEELRDKRVVVKHNDIELELLKDAGIKKRRIPEFLRELGQKEAIKRIKEKNS